MALSRIVPPGGTAGQVLAKVGTDDHDVEWTDGGGGGGGGSGLLFELDTTTTTDVAGTTECQGESGPGGNAPAGTLTPTGNVASAWMASDKVLSFDADASFQGVLVRRILTGTLPAAGWILDVGIADLVSDPNAYGLIMFGYQQNSGTAFTGFGLRMRDGAANCDLIAIGDDGSTAPHTPVLVANTDGFNAALSNWDDGPVRLVIEFAKLDAANPAQWRMRIQTISVSGQVYSSTYSGTVYPDGSFATPLAIDGFSPDRIGIGHWNVGGAQTSTIAISHLRVFELGPGASTGSDGITELSGDVTAGPGTGPQTATVVALQGFPISAATPGSGDVLAWDGAQWEPTAGAGGGITELTGDVTAGPGSGSQAAVVVALQGRDVSAAAPSDGDVLTWDAGASEWSGSAPWSNVEGGTPTSTPAVTAIDGGAP